MFYVYRILRQLMWCVCLLKDKQMRVKYNNEEPLLSFIPAYGASERDQQA